MDAHDPGYAGQHFYGAWFLRIYDPFVLGFFCHVIWRCPTRLLVQHYQRHLGRRHLDVGPGTGYFLDRTRSPADGSLVLLDPNSDVLAHTSRRLAHLNPTRLQADVCQPLPLAGQFDSIALNYVLHCLPGPMLRRADVIRSLAAQLAPNGVLFGATVLGTPELHTWLSRTALRVNNQGGIFDNLSDTEDDLRQILEQSFSRVDIEIVGTAAVFSARA
jgi:SAM-dependent methyltransferase